MKKLIACLWEEEILQAMALIFVMLAFCAAAVVLTQPLQLPEPARTLYYAVQDPVKNLEFIVFFSLGGTVLAGIIMAVVSMIQWRGMLPK